MWKKAAVAISVLVVTGAAVNADALTPTSRNLRYTGNYGRASIGYDFGPTMNTVVSITNRASKPNDIAVAFLGQQGDMQCLAVGKMNPGQTGGFGTTAGIDPESYNYSPVTVNFPAFRVAEPSVSPPTTTQDICDDFEGRVEIYSQLPNLQVAPWLINNGNLTSIPMQSKKQSSKGGH